TLTRSYYMEATPVTQQQFEKVMGGPIANPSTFTQANGGGPDFPVESVNWFEAEDFCRRLSALKSEKAAGRVYRLPTEAEWEYACRAGTETPFWQGTSLSSKQANFDGNKPYGDAPKGPSLQQPNRSNKYPPNPWGLYDMQGNVWQWCADRYGADYYQKSPLHDPRGPTVGTDRVVRGGSWFYE